MQGRIGSFPVFGARIMGGITYTPAHITAGGKLNNQKAEVTLCINTKFGDSERQDIFDATAWGRTADNLCRYGAPGKEFCMELVPNYFKGHLWNIPVPGQKPSHRLDQNGQPILVPKIGFRIVSGSLAYSDDSAKYLDFEINLGLRGPQWATKGTPDFIAFDQIRQLRKVTVWDGAKDTYFYARVFVPQGVTLVNPAEAGKVANPINELQFWATAYPNFDPPLTAQPKMDPQAQAGGRGQQQLIKQVANTLGTGAQFVSVAKPGGATMAASTGSAPLEPEVMDDDVETDA